MGSESGPEGNSPGGGSIKSPPCLEDGLQGRAKDVLVISDGVATIGNGLIQLLIAYETADIPAPGTQGSRERERELRPSQNVERSQENQERGVG